MQLRPTIARPNGRFDIHKCSDAMAYTDLDREMMLRALALALRGKGRVSPNPLVGCVIVNARGHVIGEGAHLAFGGPHAEPNAIRDAESHGHSVRGATVYVTLEPHAHSGKTPPCSKLLVEKGIARCVVAMQDPNPLVSGNGIQELHDAGIDVNVGLLEEEVREFNRFFIKHVTTGFPFVTLKLASSLDGRSALANGESKWITSEASRARVHALRAEHDAVMIGARTALADDPSLTVRLVEGQQPRRIVLDARSELPPTLHLFTDATRERTIVVTTREAAIRHGGSFGNGIELLKLEAAQGGRIDLKELFRTLGERGIASILVEAGPTLAGSLVQQKLFDELIVFYGPMVLGGDAKPAIGSLGLLSLADALRLTLKNAEQIDNDIMLRFR